MLTPFSSLDGSLDDALRPDQTQPQSRQAHRPARRWGVVIVAIGYSLLWQGKFWLRQLYSWQVALAIVFSRSDSPFLDEHARPRTPVAH